MFQFLIPAAMTLIGAKMGADATKSAARTAAEQQQRGLELQQRMYEEGVARQQPFLETGTEFFNQLAALQRGGPGAAQQFLQMDPGYGFRMSEGLKALERGAAARGGLISGNALRAAQRYGQDVASQEFGQAYNRLAQLANVGPAAAGVLTGLGERYGERVGRGYGALGETMGGAQLARGSIYERALGDIAGQAGRYFRQPQYQTPAPVETRDIYGGMPLAPLGPGE